MMIPKTVRINGRSTTIKLEKQIVEYLRHIALQRRKTFSQIINEIIEDHPGKINRASTVRMFALERARIHAELLEQQEKINLGRIIDAFPIPALIADNNLAILRSNKAFGSWLNLDGQRILGKRLDSLMVLRGGSQKVCDVWSKLLCREEDEAEFKAYYASTSPPGETEVRAAKVFVVALSTLSTISTNPNKRTFLIKFEE